MSAALTLVKHVWDNSPRHAKSWLRLNQALGKSVDLAIVAGLKFNPEDFQRIHEDFRGPFWFGESDGERFYSEAVKHDHLSACQSFEAFKGRKPFLLETGARVAVGSIVYRWEEARTVTLTSFTTCAGAEPAVILCAYSYANKKQKVAKRYRVSLSTWVAEMKRRKAARTPPARWSTVTDPKGQDWIVVSTTTRGGGRMDLETVASSGEGHRYPRDRKYSLSLPTFLQEDWEVKAPPPALEHGTSLVLGDEPWMVTSLRDENVTVETVARHENEPRRPRESYSSLTPAHFIRLGFVVKAPAPKDPSGARAFERYVRIGTGLDLQELVDAARKCGLRVMQAYKPNMHVYYELALYGRPAQVRALDAAWRAAAKKKDYEAEKEDFLSRRPKGLVFGVNLHLTREHWVDKDEVPAGPLETKKQSAKKARAKA